MENSNLPQTRVSTVVMSGEYVNIIKRVERELKIRIIKTIESYELPYPERFHADMQIHQCGNALTIIRNSCSILENKIRNLDICKNIVICDRSSLSDYPNNITLNAAHIGDYLLCKKSHSYKDLLLWYIDKGVRILDVKQGYARCSTAIISHNAVITDDESILKSCKRFNDIDVLKVSKGSVKLKGCEYGFIGGCCFKADKNNLVFFGDVRQHSDYKDIKAFCRNYGVELLSLANCELIDIGGAVILK